MVSLGESSVQQDGGDVPREGSFSTPVEPFSGFCLRKEDSVAVPDTGAAANSACFTLLKRHKSVFERCAKFKFGVGRMGGIRFAADVPAGIAVCPISLPFFLVDADMPALRRKGGVGVIGGKISLHLGRLGVEVLSNANMAGHYVLSAAALESRVGRPAVCGAPQSVSWF